jgi:hypothetical protein
MKNLKTNKNSAVAHVLKQWHDVVLTQEICDILILLDGSHMLRTIVSWRTGARQAEMFAYGACMS